jgi:nucleotide-binding universal stress UspA family protein
MFKHILIPTDGTKLSQNAIENGIRLASELGARITVLHVLPEFGRTAYQIEMLDETHDQFLLRSKARADKILGEVRAAAKQAGVDCEALYAIDDQAYLAIVNMAAKQGCDLILMASHGSKGLQALLLGSETQKVLVHCALPVLVYR